MWFFIPRCLIEFEYLNSDTTENSNINEQAKSFRNEMDFAFFVVNFGYSKEDYNALTQTEKLFIMKAFEDKAVLQTSLINNAVANAIANCMRKKSKKAVPLWKKRSNKIIPDKEIMDNTIKQIIENEKKQGTAWVDKIYKANGIIKPNRRGGNG